MCIIGIDFIVFFFGLSMCYYFWLVVLLSNMMNFEVVDIGDINNESL